MTDEHKTRTTQGSAAVKREEQTPSQRIRETYERQTGEDLPDHVIQNIEKLQLYSPPWKQSDTDHTRSGIIGGDGLESISPVVMTAFAWIIAAGSYGYIAASYPEGNHPEITGFFLLLGIGVGAGIAGALAIAGRKTEEMHE